MRTLVVGSDQRRLSALKSVLKNLGECKEAVDSETAILLFQDSFGDGQAFDLVTVDIAMQKTAKKSIIKEIRRIEDEHHVLPGRDACVIVISTTHNKQLITDCVLDGCNGFFDQDFEASRVLETLGSFNLIGPPFVKEKRLSGIVSSQELIEKATSMINREDFSLPPAPKLAMRIRQLLGSGADIGAIEELLKHDLCMSTNLIKLSNSVVYGGVGKNTSAGEAIRRLGSDRTIEVVMSICCRGFFVTNHPAYKKLVEGLWWHSMACAHATDVITDFKKLSLQEDVFLLGLLHDIGKLILIQAAGDLHKPKKSNLVIKPEELSAMVTADHQQLGVRLLKMWGYPEAFASLIQIGRENKDMPPGTVEDVLRQSDLLAINSGFADGIETDINSQEALTEIGISLDVQEKLSARIISRIEELRYVFT